MLSLHNNRLNHCLATTEESHSELGAAHDLMADIWEQLRDDRIELSTGKAVQERFCRRFLDKATRIWVNFLRHPADILMSLLLSILLIGIYVAESSGGVLSANIISDTAALASTAKCALVSDIDWSTKAKRRDPLVAQATAYAQQCYNARKGAEGCNYLYKQSIEYTETADDICPFAGKTCALGRNGAHTFDTGFSDASYTGINTAKRYQFRKRTTCAPLIPDGENINITKVGEDVEYDYFGCRRGTNWAMGSGFSMQYCIPLF